MGHELTVELKHVHEHGILERKRTRLYLVGFAAVMMVVASGLLLALRWIGLTVQ
jgi:hypothetical protein